MAAEVTDQKAAELERLRAENEALKQQIAEAEALSTDRAAKVRNGFAIAIMLFATFALALAVPAVWVNRMVTNTDYYVATVAPLADDPAIQNAVAGAASDAVIQQLDLQTRLKSRLPEDLQFLAAPVSSAADGFVREQATNFVRSDAFPKIWTQVNTVGHKAVVTAITGKDTGVIQAQAGTIALDLGTLVDELVAKLSDSGFSLVEKLPTGRLDRTITLYHSDNLAQAATLVDQIQRLALFLPLFGLGLMAGAVGLASNRRRALLWLGGGLLVWTVLPLQAVYLGQSVVGAKLNALAGIPTDAAQNAYGIIFADLVRMERLFVAIALLVIIAALLSGPYKWAVALRRGLSGGLAGVSSHMELGAFGTWVGARMKGLRVVGYLAAAGLLVLLPLPRSMTQVWWIAALLVVWLAAVQLFGAGSTPPSDPMTER